MATTVISQITPSGDGTYMRIKGTVGGTAHQYAMRNHGIMTTGGGPDSLNILPQTIAQDFANHYGLLAASIADIASDTVTLYNLDAVAATVVFGGTPVAVFDENYVEVTATVNGTSTVAQISMQDFINKRLVGNEVFNEWVARKVYEQSQRNTLYNLSNADYVASFTTT
jgi:hypothetical protein